MRIIHPWCFQHLLAVFLHSDGQIACPRCGDTIALPAVTAFASDVIGRGVVHVSKSADSTLLDAFTEYFSHDQDFSFEFTVAAGLDEVKAAISEHVVHYKELHKRLAEAARSESLEEHVAENYELLTPDALAAGLIGFTGLVKGYGGHLIDPASGGKVDIEKAIPLYVDFLASVQLMTWHCIARRSSSKHAYNYDLATYIRPMGILGENSKIVGELVGELVKEPSIAPLERYVWLALHSQVCRADSIDNPLGLHWAHSYFAFERWLRVGGEESELTSYQVAPELAKETISEKHAWNAIALVLQQEVGQKSVDDYGRRLVELGSQLDEIAERLGYKDLVRRVLGSAQVGTSQMKDGGGYADIVCEQIRKDGRRSLEVERLLRFSRSALIAEGVEAVDRVCKVALRHAGEDRECQARVESWFGECTKLLSAPRVFMDLVGESPRAWEKHLPIALRLRLANERANGLRLLRHPGKALAITDALLDEIDGDDGLEHERYILQLNRGILLRETGAIDASYRHLSSLRDNVELERSAGLLHSFATTCCALGRVDEAVEVLEQARASTSATSDPQPESIESMLAVCYANVGRHADAVQILRSLAEGRCTFKTTATVATAYAALLYNRYSFEDRDLREMHSVVDEMFDGLITLKESGDNFLLEQCLRVLGHFVYYFAPAQSKGFWDLALRVSEESEGRAHPSVFARLATIAYRNRDTEEARRLLMLCSKSLIAEYRLIGADWIGIGAGQAVIPMFDDLVREAIRQGAPWHEVRMISEMSRDAVGKSKLIRALGATPSSLPATAVGISDEIVSQLADQNSTRGVLEWVADGATMTPILTVVATDGAVETAALSACPENLVEIRAVILHRLSVWHAGRHADPFDYAGWRKFEIWLNRSIGERLKEDAHIALIDHESITGLPLHVALTPRWRCSYAPSWTTLLRKPTDRPAESSRIGVFSAPRFRESSSIRQAFSDAVRVAAEWGDANDRPVDVFANASADKNAFEQVMKNCSTVCLFCHGYSSPDDQEIALLVTNDGVAPPLYAPGGKEPLDAYRISWRDLYSLPKSAPVILSAGCSTGLQWRTGAGEQIGLFGALRQSGTRSFIGPRWDVLARSVVPLIHEVVERYYDQRMSLLDALHSTCESAQERMPRWLAWSLALEGDWR